MSISNIINIARRELQAYFNSAIAYIFLIVFIAVSAGLYITEFFIAGRADMRSFFNFLPVILCAFIPALTMRLWAEDRRGNTLELLLTFPMKTHELVFGKYFASLLFYLIALATSLTIPVMLKFLGKPDLGPIIGSYLGSFLLGSFFIAFGIFVSGICKDQIVAFISTLVICFVFILSGTEFVAASIDGWLPGFGSLLKDIFGVLPHFASFARGVIDIRDLLYFVIGTGIFLTLNGFWLEGRMRPKANTIFVSATAVCVGIFLVFNWFVLDINLGRFDLTERKIFTVSETTKKVLKELKVPALVKYYVSPQSKMPTQIKTLEQDITDKLQEFKIASGGKFDYKIFHMEAANVDGSQAGKPGDKEGGESSLEEQLERKGIEPFRIQSIESDQMGVRMIYSAMSIAYKEKPEEIISQVLPNNVDELEYLILSKIFRMTLNEVPNIALVAPYEDKTMDPSLASILSQLGGGQVPEQFRQDEFRLAQGALEYAGYKFSRVKLSKDEPIPANSKTLVILNPKSLNERQRYEINRFIHEGGSVLLGVQNKTYDYRPAGRRGISVFARPENPDVNPLIEPWGVTIDDSILMDEQSEMIQISGGMQGPFSIAIPVKTPLHILIGQDGMNPNYSITSNLSPIFYLWGSAINLNDPKLKELNLSSEILLKSSPQSWKYSAQNPTLSLADFAPPSQFGGPYPLAVMVSGQFPNNFLDRKTLPMWPEDSKPATEGEAVPSEEDLAKQATQAPVLNAKPGKLLLVGASTIFKEDLMGGQGGHLNFFLNSIDALTLNDDLTKIRSKQEISRRIRKVSTAENIAWKFFVMMLVPIIILVIGGIRLFLRRQVKQNYLKALSIVDV